MADKAREEAVLAHLLMLLTESGKTDRELEAALKLKPKTVSNWRRGLSHGYMRILPEIADFLAISPVLLWEGHSAEPKHVSNEEWELITAYRTLSNADASKRRAVRDMFRKIVQLCSK